MPHHMATAQASVMQADRSKIMELMEILDHRHRPTRSVEPGTGSTHPFPSRAADEAIEWLDRSCELAGRERWTAFRPWPEAWLAHVRLAG
jgi:hypothetical protein